ncbi:MAG: hypothetical protein WCX65_10715, partial [bacterium]
MAKKSEKKRRGGRKALVAAFLLIVFFACAWVGLRYALMAGGVANRVRSEVETRLSPALNEPLRMGKLHID